MLVFCNNPICLLSSVNLLVTSLRGPRVSEFSTGINHSLTCSCLRGYLQSVHFFFVCEKTLWVPGWRGMLPSYSCHASAITIRPLSLPIIWFFGWLNWSLMCLIAGPSPHWPVLSLALTGSLLTKPVSSSLFCLLGREMTKLRAACHARPGGIIHWQMRLPRFSGLSGKNGKEAGKHQSQNDLVTMTFPCDG